ncbi:PREDICTED: NAC transcription factor 29-like [Tarenaya hassleriana]|uniref:NAC transcription factor 29-like n=1 Tax=Tarenaya hassleriana TaxID=28532 RepID=UPI00053C499F|nr:PREDICTED: NAC transcription factor 29-like [Tarenaya hassleriana]
MQSTANDGEDNRSQRWCDFSTLPPGVRFRPTDEEIILSYLLPKLRGEKIPPNQILRIKLYEHGPERIEVMFRIYREFDEEVYFFTTIQRKYKNGERPRRTVPGGYWKATGKEREIFSGETLIGFKKSLVLYRGDPPKGEKTNYVIHEYRAYDPERSRPGPDGRKLDEHVMCRMYQKAVKAIAMGSDKFYACIGHHDYDGHTLSSYDTHQNKCE